MENFILFLKSEKIPVYRVGEIDYERSVATSNLLYRFSRPGCVVQPERSSQVQIVVEQARSRQIPITIKNGGHSYAGASTTDKGVLLDLFKMTAVNLDMRSKTVTLQAGARWAHAYKQLVYGRYDGYIINGGRCPSVGVSGFVLGGGLSPFGRSFGMGCDSLKEATIVTADSKLITVKDSDDPKSDKGRLFWALRGAGGGNFGVVVELKMSIHELQNKDGNVVAGRYTWSPKPEAMDEFLNTMNRFYTTDWPDQITIDATWLCDLPQTTSELQVRFTLYYDGNKKEFDQVIDRCFGPKEPGKQLKRRSLPEKSTRFFHETLVAQWAEEQERSIPEAKSYKLYSSFVFKNDAKRIGKVTSILREEMKVFRDKFTGEQASFHVTWIHSGGQAGMKKRSATAFRWRDCVYHTYVTLEWQDKWLERDMRGFLQWLKARLRDLNSMTEQATFINFADGSLSSTAAEKAYYGNNRQELQRIKKIWDKDGFFSWAQGVRLPQPKEQAMKQQIMPIMRQGKFAMEHHMPSVSTAHSTVEMEGDEENGEFAPMAADEDSVVNDEALTDGLAGLQWENVTLPPKNPFGGRIQSLSDLDF